MAINTRDLANFDQFFQTIIKSVEGRFISTPENLNDGTITLGYGYTFVRNGRRYTTLGPDLSSIGITLTPQENNGLVQIENAATPEERDERTLQLHKKTRKREVKYLRRPME